MGQGMLMLHRKRSRATKTCVRRVRAWRAMHWRSGISCGVVLDRVSAWAAASRNWKT